LKLDDLWGPFQPRPFYDSVILWLIKDINSSIPRIFFFFEAVKKIETPLKSGEK